MEAEQELKKPKVRRAGGLSLNQTVDKLVDQVENPADREAKATFGYRQTEEERRREKALHLTLELCFWVVALVVVYGVIRANWLKIKAFLDLAMGDADPVIVEEPAATPVPERTVSSYFTGTAYQIGDDLGWIRREFFSDLTYYFGGEVTHGMYTGAKRYFAVGLAVGDSSLATYEFWELPDGSVLLNGEKQNPQRWLQLLNDYYVRMFFADKVVMTDQLEGDWPETIQISPSMLLYKREILTDLGPYDGINVGSPRLALALPSTYYQQLAPLQASDHLDLKFYSKMYSGDELFSQIAPNIAADDEWIADTYLFGGTKVVVTDRTGVSYVYELVLNDTWEKYRSTRDNERRYVEFYQQDLIKYTTTASWVAYKERTLNGQVVALPDGQPKMPAIQGGLPGINFSIADFEFAGRKPQFESFVSGYTAVCYPRIDAKVVQNLTRDDLVQVGKLFYSQLPVYILADDEHALNRLAYNLKLVDNTIKTSEQKTAFMELFMEIEDMNENDRRDCRSGEKTVPLPSLLQYAAAMPVLFIPDPWGRYLMVWENDLDFLEDCGIIHAQ